MLRRRSLALACAVAATVGCGGGPSVGSGAFNVGGPTMCGQVPACGGDITGTWTFTTGCVTAGGIADVLAGDGCPGETAAVTGLNIAGTMTFNSDMTYSINALEEQGIYEIVIPGSCLQGASCDYVQAQLQAPGEFQTASCTGSYSCSCTAAQTPATNSESGTYTLTGTTFTTTSSSGSTNMVSYCVFGTHLHLLAIGKAGVDQDTVGTKQ